MKADAEAGKRNAPAGYGQHTWKGTWMRNQRGKGAARTDWLGRNVRAAFFGALIFGLIAQGMGLLNKFSWHDDIFSLFLTGETITSGRWMLHVLGSLEILIFGDGHYSLPLMNGLFSLLCIAFSAGLIAGLLKIRTPFLCALVGAMMAAFPTVTALFGFMFTVPYYMLALAMITAGACLICGSERWEGKVAGVVLAGCSVGIYQAFLPVFLSVILIYDIRMLTAEDEKLSVLAGRILVQGLCVLGSMAFYAGCSHLFLALTDSKLSPYMGINEAGSLPLQTYLERVGRAYREFFQPSRNTIWDMVPQHSYYAYLLMIFAEAVLGAVRIGKTWKKSRGRALLAAAMLALVPLGCHFIFVMSEEVHSLMGYGQVMHVVLLAWLTDTLDIRPHLVRRISAAALTALIGMTCVMYARYDNQCYLKTQFQQQEAISWYTTLVTRIKSAEGYRDELPVAWLNDGENTDLSLYNMDEFNFLYMSGYDADIQDYVNNWAWEAFLKRWCGFGPSKVYVTDSLEKLPEVQDMPHYPEDGSIRVIQDTVVVKF